MKNLTSIGENLNISINNSLISLKGLENLTTIHGYCIIEGNNRLISLQGLENLTTVNDLFNISENNKLLNLHGLDNLTSVNGSLVIVENPSLTSLQGLTNLTLAENLYIYVNNKLQNLHSLENLQSLGDLLIENNPVLNDCCAIADLISKVTGEVNINDNGLTCNSEDAILEDCSPMITGFALVDAITDEDIFNLNILKVPEIINLLETGNHLNIRGNKGRALVGSVVFELDGEIFRTENVAPFALAGDAPPGDYFCWTPTEGRHILTATPYEGKKATGKQGKTLTIDFLVIDQPLAVTSFTLIATVDNSDLFELKDGGVFFQETFDFTGLNIRANTYGEVESVVFDLNEIKNFNTENVPPFPLAGDDPPGYYLDCFPGEGCPGEGVFILTATPYSKPNGKGKVGMPLTITFKSLFDGSRQVTGFVLVDAETNQDILVMYDGITLDLEQISGSVYNIRAVTHTNELPDGKIFFDYDGIKNFRTERLAPYALGGDTNGDFHPFSLSDGKHTLKATPSIEGFICDEEECMKSITFFVKNGNQALARKTSVVPIKTKVGSVETEDLPATLGPVQVIAYPNPTENLLKIQVVRQTDSRAPVSIQLYDQLGEKVWEGKLNADHSAHIEVGHLPSGIYFLKVVSLAFSQFNRVIIH